MARLSPKSFDKWISVIVSITLLFFVMSCQEEAEQLDTKQTIQIEEVNWTIENIDETFFTKASPNSKNSVFISFLIKLSGVNVPNDISSVNVVDETGRYWNLTQFYDTNEQSFGRFARFYEYENSHKINIGKYTVIVTNSNGDVITEEFEIQTPCQEKKVGFVYSEDFHGWKDNGTEAIKRSYIAAAFWDEGSITINHFNNDTRTADGYIWLYDQNNELVGVSKPFSEFAIVDASAENHRVILDENSVYLVPNKSFTDTDGLHIVMSDRNLSDSSDQDHFHYSISKYYTILDPDEVLTDKTFSDTNDILYFLSKDNRIILRYSVSKNQYIEPIGIGTLETLRDQNVKDVSLSKLHERIYIGYSNGQITYIDLMDDKFSEYNFAELPLPIRSLIDAENYLVAWIDQTGSSIYGLDSHHIFDINGSLTDSDSLGNQPGFLFWNGYNNHLYFFKNDYVHYHLLTAEIDQNSGQLTVTELEADGREYQDAQPVFFSNTQRLLTGSGLMLDSENLSWKGELPWEIKDAVWDSRGDLILIREGSNETLLERRNDKGVVIETRIFSGSPQQIFPDQSQYMVLTQVGEVTKFNSYLPDDDMDADGVNYPEDKFPLDPAASIDSDGDGYPDEWNSGYSAIDSVSGLVLDSYPDQESCFLLEHGDGTNCDFAIPKSNHEPQKVFVDKNGIFYLLDDTAKLVHRYSVITNEYLPPIPLGLGDYGTIIAPISMQYLKDQHRLYFGYEEGQITYIDLTADVLEEKIFTIYADSIGGLVAIGDFILAKEEKSHYWDTHHIIDENGLTKDSKIWSSVYPYFTWDKFNNKVFLCCKYSYGNDFYYEEIDPASGQILASGKSEYFDGTINPPLVISNDGSTILTGNGDFFNSDDLSWEKKIYRTIKDALWDTNDDLIIISEDSSNTLLERWNSNGVIVEYLSVKGTPLGIYALDDNFVIVTEISDQIQFTHYQPSDDTDGDGASNLSDSFPVDPAAAVDTDRDGYPDAWNTGYTEQDSSTGLILDYYPNESVCYFPEHGDGIKCDVEDKIPEYEPRMALRDKDGVVYLLSISDNTVYRYNPETNEHLDPIKIGLDNGQSIDAPLMMTYSEAHHRLYFGYGDGQITYIDILTDIRSEVLFAKLPSTVAGLVAFGDYLLAQDKKPAPMASESTSHVFNAEGQKTGSQSTGDEGIDFVFREYVWNPLTNRIYYVDELSIGQLCYLEVNPINGQITSFGKTPFDNTTNIKAPVFLTSDNQEVLVGNGIFFSADSLERNGVIYGLDLHLAYWPFTDVEIENNGDLITIRASSEYTILRRLSREQGVLEEIVINGAAIDIFKQEESYLLPIVINSRVKFITYIPSDDSDNDGVPNLDDRFPWDPSASADSDGDRYPDAWNAGFSALDSTMDLILDAYPSDSACFLIEHGDGSNCNIASRIPAYTPSQIAADKNDVLLFLSGGKIYRFSSATQKYLNPIYVGIRSHLQHLPPYRMAYAEEQDRIYLGYTNGIITYIDLTEDMSKENLFTTLRHRLDGLVATGENVFAAGRSWNSFNQHVYDSNGVLACSEENQVFSRTFVWSNSKNRVYFLSEDIYDLSIHYHEINPSNGQTIETGEAPHNRLANVAPFITISDNGEYAIVENGDIYLTEDLSLHRSLGHALIGAAWSSRFGLVVVRASEGTWMERYTYGGSELIESVKYSGYPIAVYINGSIITIVVTDGNGRLFFHDYTDNLSLNVTPSVASDDYSKLINSDDFRDGSLFFMNIGATPFVGEQIPMK